jgi:hypothetical protein
MGEFERFPGLGKIHGLKPILSPLSGKLKERITLLTNSPPSNYATTHFSRKTACKYITWRVGSLLSE